MNATLIISTEYEANKPSIFVLANGQYYGCMIYPKGRNYPSDADFWKNATCSDSHRFFKVKEVTYSDQVFNTMEKLQSEIIEAEKCIKEDRLPFIPQLSGSKNSKAYKDYLLKKEEQHNTRRQIWEHNDPYEKQISKNRDELEKLILSALPNEN